jgi:hypothetical protein
MDEGFLLYMGGWYANSVKVLAKSEGRRESAGPCNGERSKRSNDEEESYGSSLGVCNAANDREEQYAR